MNLFDAQTAGPVPDRGRLSRRAEGLRGFIAQAVNEKVRPTGEVFNYSSIQTDILGLIIQKSCGMPLANFFEQELWSKLGAERDAGFGTDGHGQPIAQGAISMTLPDFARAAMLVLNQGQNHAGEQIVDATFFEDLVTPNAEVTDAFTGEFEAVFGENASYRSHFWVLDAAAGQFMMGVHGQLAYFDLSSRFALLAFGSYPIAGDALMIASLSTLIEALTEAAQPSVDINPPDMNLFLLVDR